jgi:hypothetical protein
MERKRLKKKREKKKEKKEKEQAQKKQQKEKGKQAAKTSNSIQQPQTGRTIASKKVAPKRKRVEECTSSASGSQGRKSSQALPPKTTRTGHSITIPWKFR